MINAPDTPQILLSIEAAPARERQFVLRVNRSEQDYFTDRSRQAPGGYAVEIPRPLQETALLDDVAAQGSRVRLGARPWAASGHNSPRSSPRF